jgi:EpsI family protein
VLGPHVVRSILFPLAFLIFAIPLGEGLIPVLMDITAVFTVKALVLSGFPVYWEGMFFSIPSGSFEVAKACSGVRYLFASVALGSLFAYISYQSVWRRAIFILISILLPIIANGFRAYGIVLIAHLSDMKYATGIDHLIYGWLFFGLIIFALFFIGNKWRENKNPEQLFFSSKNDVIVRKTVAVQLSLVVIVFLGVVGKVWVQNNTVDVVGNELQQPYATGMWQISDNTTLPWRPDFKGATHSVRSTYTNNQTAIQLYIAYYAGESQDAELINQSNQLYQTKEWIKTRNRQQNIVVDNTNKIKIQQIMLQSGGRQRILWYWYDLSGYITSNIYKGKLIQAGTRFLGKDKGGAVVAIMIDINEGRETAMEAMHEFIKTMYPAIQTSMAEVRGTK